MGGRAGVGHLRRPRKLIAGFRLAKHRVRDEVDTGNSDKHTRYGVDENKERLHTVRANSVVVSLRSSSLAISG